MSETVKSLWNQLIDIGFNVRKNRLNGLEEWQPYKNKYSNYMVQDYSIGVPLRDNFINLCESFDYKYTDKDQTDTILKINDEIFDNKIETNHFLIQHFRIPRLEHYRLLLVKILQLAYNIGQLRAVFLNENAFSNELKNFYYSNHLDDIGTYFDSDIHYKLVTIKQVGSGHYYKYLKYKKKYFDLRTRINNFI
ncbi:MAG: hypothetical protein Satyrvirus25_15 [Satyrvirus sp.]|uniref:Uncharacterized protein n=1 Tax=Satyrvirus sp. TaxID=2487771 RepID=A0A3G5AEJ6_9VIRU|nr:MAG: hypothetical protein Satyrvirus25_15 [Satyrvirus sp.]